MRNDHRQLGNSAGQSQPTAPTIRFPIPSVAQQKPSYKCQQQDDAKFQNQYDERIQQQSSPGRGDDLQVDLEPNTQEEQGEEDVPEGLDASRDPLAERCDGGKRSVSGPAQAAARVASSGCQFQGKSSAMRRAG